MALNSSEIERVLAEMTPVLRGGWIQKIQQPTGKTLIFDIRVPGTTHRLLVSCNPDTARLHLTDQRVRSPETPPAFCRFLRAHFQGSRIEAITQVPNDRLVEIVLRGRGGLHTLVCALTGKQANVLVLDHDRRVIRDLLDRRDLVGQPYVHPARQPHDSPDPQPCRFIGSGKFPVSSAIDAHYKAKEAAMAFARAKQERLRTLHQAIKKERRRIDAWRNDLARVAQYRHYARYGELLKANLGAIRKGADHITVTDYFDEQLPEVTIPLDPAKSAQGNMDDYFRKYRKSVVAERELTPRLEEAERNLNRLSRELLAVESGTWTPPVLLVPEAGTSPPAASRSFPQRSEGGKRGPFRRFLSADGLAIFVGRSAKENEELTFGWAKSDDLWFHARGAPGSHVVVRMGKGTDPPPETLQDAATLALLYSDLSKSGKGEVIYTRRKWVKKAKGQAPGAVIVTRETTLCVKMDKARLDALKFRASR